MADTLTINYNFVKPEVGASPDTWGNKTNNNWDNVDALFFNVFTLANNTAAVAANTLKKDGSVAVTGNFNWGGFKISNLAPGVAPTDAANMDQVGIVSRVVEQVKNVDYTVVSADAGKVTIGNKATLIVFTLPSAASVSGKSFEFRNTGVGDLRLLPVGSDTVEGVTPYTLQTGEFCQLWSNGTMWRASSSARPATLAEAQAGVATSVFMDPVGVRASEDFYVVPMVGKSPPKNLVVLVVSNTGVDVDADEMTFYDGTRYFKKNGINLTINLPADLDTGAEAAGVWYGIYAILNPTSGVVSAKFVQQGNTLVLPVGFTASFYCGSVRNDGVSNLYRSTQKGDTATWNYGVNPISPLRPVTGASGGVSVSLADYMPASALEFMGTANGTFIGSSSHFVSVGRGPTVAEAFIGNVGGSTAFVAMMPFTIRNSMTLWWEAGGTSLSINALGWKDSI